MTPCAICLGNGVVLDRRETRLTGVACYADCGMCAAAHRPIVGIDQARRYVEARRNVVLEARRLRSEAMERMTNPTKGISQ